MTAEEYAAVQGYILGGAQFFEPEIDPAAFQPKELLRRLVNVHIAPSPLCRAAYTEKALKAAVLTGTKQYVILGAGLDTFAFRETEVLSKHRVFEVDHPLTQADKKKRIARAGWTIPDNLTFVPVDFTKDSLAERLVTAGFDPSVKSFFSWLGVTYYLSAEAIDAMLSSLFELCADGSALVFDYPGEDFFDAPEKRVQNTIMMAKAGGEPMKTVFSYRIMDEACADKYKTNSSSYKDIARSDWFNTYVATLENAGVIVDTKTGGNFRPNKAITRAELATMLAQFATTTTGASSFKDVASSHWASREIAIAAKMGWINGYPDGTFRPDQTITRAEMMAMVNRALERTPESEDDLLSGMKTWSDNARTSAWYYLDVQEATNGHTYTKSGTHESWKKLAN